MKTVKTISKCHLKLKYIFRIGAGYSVFKVSRYNPSDAEEPAEPPRKRQRGHTDPGDDQQQEPSPSRRSRRDSDSSGVCLPTVNSKMDKYSLDMTEQFNRIFGSSSNRQASEILCTAFSTASWRAMESAWNNMTLFSQDTRVAITYPLSQDFISNFIVWLMNVKQLKSSTIQSYLSSISSILKLKDLESPSITSYITKKLLKGSKNRQALTADPLPSRKVLTLSLLKIIGHEVSLSDWPTDSKRVFWTACCTLFFGSLRAGEILSSSKTKYSYKSCLLWEDVKFLEDSILIRVKMPKCKTDSDSFVDIFKFPEKSCCPVRALKGLQKHSVTSDDKQKPVFCFKNGSLLTLSTFNTTVRTLLQSTMGNSSREYSSHSFRAAIPSALAACPDTANSEEIKIWGRWDSDTYKTYTRLEINKRKSIHDKASKALLYRAPRGSGSR